MTQHQKNKEGREKEGRGQENEPARENEVVDAVVGSEGIILNSAMVEGFYDSYSALSLPHNAD